MLKYVTLYCSLSNSLPQVLSEMQIFFDLITGWEILWSFLFRMISSFDFRDAEDKQFSDL